MISGQSKQLIGIAAFAASYVLCSGMRAQDDAGGRDSGKALRPRIATGAPTRTAQRTATIHWQRVPLRDALGRLQTLFDDIVFVDRRVDPTMRVNLDIDDASAEEVVAAIAAGEDLGVARVGPLVYLGPTVAAEQLRSISGARSQEMARLSADSRASLTQKQPADWPRLSEPRRVIASIVDQRGWRLANADAIPHDLWPAGRLPGLTLAEQLAVLLVGFDLTFELRPNDRSIVVVPFKSNLKPSSVAGTSNRSEKPHQSTRAKKDAQHVYTLRVREKPVGAVLQELSQRLRWTIQIDEESISKAGKSLDERVSFSVENADQGRLLEALLRPAGLDYQLEGDRVRIIAGRYEEK